MKVEHDYRDVFSFGEMLPALVASHFVCDSTPVIFSALLLIAWLSAVGSDASFSFGVIDMTADVAAVDCVGVFFDGEMSPVELLERISLARKSSASVFSSRHDSVGSVNELKLSSPSNDFNDGDERTELLLLLDKIDDDSKLLSKFKSSVK